MCVSVSAQVHFKSEAGNFYTLLNCNLLIQSFAGESFSCNFASTFINVCLVSDEGSKSGKDRVLRYLAEYVEILGRVC